LNPLHVVLLGILEGLTEFLPVSSTGHLILLGESLGHNDDAAKTLEIAIQAGAVLAVIVYYRDVLWALVRGLLDKKKEQQMLFLALGVAFLPAAGIGFFLHSFVKARLMGPTPVATALIVGGLVMIAAPYLFPSTEHEPKEESLTAVTLQRALIIGVCQCAALWPGFSRSMSTIVGGQASGLRAKTAAQFSFLLSIPVLGSATVLDLVKDGDALFASEGGVLALLIGLVTAFAVSLAVISVFLRYLNKFGLAPFGYYRIVLGVLVLVWAR
jgi:undecaprenyl-diphosphatase